MSTLTPGESTGLERSRLRRYGLMPGEAAPDFELSTVDGNKVSLTQFLGAPVLLVFSDPECGPCGLLAPRLERLSRRAPDVRLLMISRGTLEENIAKMRTHGLTFPIALQRRWEVSLAYAMFAMPTAYLVDASGQIAAPPALGEDAVLTLFRATAIRALLSEDSPHAS